MILATKPRIIFFGETCDLPHLGKFASLNRKKKKNFRIVQMRISSNQNLEKKKAFINTSVCVSLHFTSLIPMSDPCNYAIYGVPWIPSIYPLYVSIFIYQHQPDPKWEPWQIMTCDSWPGSIIQQLLMNFYHTKKSPLAVMWKTLRHLQHPWRIHMYAIYGNIDPINIPPLC